MNTIQDQYICQLECDLIINQRHASEGPQVTLDYIPGSNIMGILASALYSLDSDKKQLTFDLFHSGKIRFGDAHPLSQNRRTLRIPASYFKPKLHQSFEDCYIHHLIDYDSKSMRDEMKKLQLKQARNGFYRFDEKSFHQERVLKQLIVKSAYDTEKRRSKHESLFTYQSIMGGSSYGFTITYENQDLKDQYGAAINEALEGFKRIGRSRSAQYGGVRITRGCFLEIPSRGLTNRMITVYAESRLLFLDEKGDYTLQPTCLQLGISNGKINWNKSQIRTFQYAPYNGARKTFDADRVGIEKGSVFVIELESNELFTPSCEFVGSYQQEGFGKVIYNPVFLDSQDESTLSTYSEKQDVIAKSSLPSPNVKFTGKSVLFDFLNRKIDSEKHQHTVYEKANEYVKKNKQYFYRNSEQYASQWGQIRRIARGYTLTNSLSLYTLLEEYLSHGVAAERWKVGKKAKTFLSYVKQESNLETQRNLVMEIASQMAKVKNK